MLAMSSDKDDRGKAIALVMQRLGIDRQTAVMAVARHTTDKQASDRRREMRAR